MKREDPHQAIVFCRTKRGADKIERRLSKRFQNVACIHGDLAQNVRDRVMAAFREGKIRVLVATDVVGRGIDVTAISHIINYDIPQFCDDYVHRVGRTGRMGREGVAFTFVTPEEGNELTRIEMRIDRLLKRDDVPGFEAVKRDIPATPHVPAATGQAATGEDEATSKPRRCNPTQPHPRPPGSPPPAESPSSLSLIPRSSAPPSLPLSAFLGLFGPVYPRALRRPRLQLTPQVVSGRP